MEVVHLEKGLGEAVLRASGALRHGGVIIYPTDTLYGLGADALNNEAVERIYAIKGREQRKPMHAVFAGLAMVEAYAELNDTARKLAEKFLPGPLTLVLKKKPHVTSGIGRNIDTIGVRIPDSEFCLELAASFGGPYTATSANKAGSEPELSAEGTRMQLQDALDEINLLIDAGTLPLSLPSTVVHVADGAPVVLREGAISRSAIESLFT